MNGIKRFRQAIKNQQDFGDGEFHLTYQDAEDLASEIEKESGWAAGIPAPRGRRRRGGAAHDKGDVRRRRKGA